MPVSHLASAPSSMTPSALALWVTFAIVVSCMLALDLGVLQKTPREPTTKEALAWSAVWLALASVFGVGLTVELGPAKGLEFFTAYLVEQALSVDNLFVMMLIVAQLAVPRSAQRRVLVWGILGAVVLRGALVFTGTALVTRFHFLTYALGALLVVAAVKLLRDIRKADDRAEHDDVRPPAPSPLHALLGRVLPITRGFEDARFTVVKNGVRHATPDMGHNERALARVHAEGLALHIGVSNVSRKQLEETAVETARGAYDDLGLRSAVVAFCLARGLELFAHASLGGPERGAGKSRAAAAYVGRGYKRLRGSSSTTRT